MFPNYDVIVVGAGHAGCEAASSAAQLGSKVLLITMNLQTIGEMSCNPAMGGIAKGQIIREIDALGGFSGIVTDETMIQFRMLNKSKGPAMWSPRAQSDRKLFSNKWREILEENINIDFYQDMVVYLLKENDKITGVYTRLGHRIEGKSVILTNGTFLNGLIHIGEKQISGGRVSEKNSTGITEQLQSWGFESDRLKTGTPPRLDGRSIDYSKLDVQEGDEDIKGFSFNKTKKPDAQKNCWIAYTNKKVHEILETGFNKSPMFQGRIQGVGPRYCPSIEDKITRFAQRERHQLFIEPEGWNTIEIYINGFSSSLSEEVQYQALRQIIGFENCKMFRPGYAIEYDYFPPTQLRSTLETKLIKNLFFAGQINGTTGYEEAACQGLMAGINAHQNINNLEPFTLKRDEAYIGVLIDDLINKGTDEPYRMFTSRAEFRTLLRQDNADIRLTEKSYRLGLASQERMENVKRKIEDVRVIKEILHNFFFDSNELNPYLEKINSAAVENKQKASQLILRPSVTLSDMVQISPSLKSLLINYPAETLEQVEIQLKYDIYIQKEKELVSRMSALEEQIIPDSFNYDKILSLSNEARQKFNKIRPQTLGQAGRISGVNPSDVQILMVYMGR
ncbi:MAG: tRNA uridine-5-carboxymethylaminomethyl(34) synthesis enzyme MnmG [Chitinophagaceae bacterium]